MGIGVLSSTCLYAGTSQTLSRATWIQFALRLKSTILKWYAFDFLQTLVCWKSCTKMSHQSLTKHMFQSQICITFVMCRPLLLKSSFLQGKPYASVALTLKNLNIFELVLCLQGVKIIDESHDQDTTDLHKCVIFIRDYVPDLEKNHVTTRSSFSNLCICLLW